MQACAWWAAHAASWPRIVRKEEASRGRHHREEVHTWICPDDEEEEEEGREVAVTNIAHSRSTSTNTINVSTATSRLSSKPRLFLCLNVISSFFTHLQVEARMLETAVQLRLAMKSIAMLCKSP